MNAKEVRSQSGDSGSDALYLRFSVLAGELLSGSLDYRETLQNVVQAAVQTVADMCFLYLKNDRTIELAAYAHRNPSLRQRLEESERFLKAEAGYAEHPVRSVIGSGRPVFEPVITSEYIERHATGAEHADFMREMDYRSMIVAPVISRTRGIVGAIALVRTAESDAHYDADALLFAQDLGRRCGTAIGKALLYASSVEIATRFQRAALPRRLPTIDQLDFDSYYEPANVQLLVGGDWFDAFTIPDGRIGISIGDVSGHGLEAAAFMGSLRDGIRAAVYAEPDLDRVVTIADYLVSEESPGDTFATAMIAVFDPAKNTITCVAAGHPGPLLWDPKQQDVTDPFTDRGLPLGFGSLASHAASCTVSLQPRSFLAFFTDGLLEWNRDYLAGEAALSAALADERVRSSERPARALRDAVVMGPPQDDIAVLTVRVK